MVHNLIVNEYFLKKYICREMLLKITMLKKIPRYCSIENMQVAYEFIWLEAALIKITIYIIMHISVFEKHSEQGRIRTIFGGSVEVLQRKNDIKLY